MVIHMILRCIFKSYRSNNYKIVKSGLNDINLDYSFQYNNKGFDVPSELNIKTLFQQIFYAFDNDLITENDITYISKGFAYYFSKFRIKLFKLLIRTLKYSTVTRAYNLGNSPDIYDHFKVFQYKTPNASYSNLNNTSLKNYFFDFENSNDTIFLLDNKNFITRTVLKNELKSLMEEVEVQYDIDHISFKLTESQIKSCPNLKNYYLKKEDSNYNFLLINLTKPLECSFCLKTNFHVRCNNFDKCKEYVCYSCVFNFSFLAYLRVCRNCLFSSITNKNCILCPILRVSDFDVCKIASEFDSSSSLQNEIEGKK
ncbi:hypothetical protein DDB_G0294194 [Dictyostelium discoideum AX4]|uniref:Uncharacterized protein n=1 Tax=Dictyostelium discoideum TaxID=44689 RepID=Q54AU9_DICDI|nr:hypothetical protein DDB_G0294194 [Dictyostelium discoideum AX4]EAL60384.1 hypothetical protein DDB_G0294194 [Dictyostelium discoideum AX4]|eukprot:XP_628797.1 hypothetical protein DDB_G0294194 [Dictyostelium discoideum AX4]